MSDWVNLPDNINESDHFSIIYCITNTITGKKYIGKCQLWSKLTKPPLKGTKRKRKVTKPSGYLQYYGSSEQLKKDIIEFGKESFTREVLDLASCKWESSFLELLYQIRYNVISSDDFYNGIIALKLPKCPKNLREKYNKLKISFTFE